MDRGWGGFWGATDGAVTADWVVLAAAAVGLGLASVGAVRSGSGALAGDIKTALDQASVVAICQGGAYALRQLTGEREREAQDIAAQIARMSDDELQAAYAETAVKVGVLRDANESPAYVDEILDYAALFSAELEARRLEPPRDAPALSVLAGLGGACGSDGAGGTLAEPGFVPDYVNYTDPRLDEDRRAYVEEFARLGDREITRVLEEIDASFHEALARGLRDDSAKLLDLSAMLYHEALERGDPDTIRNARNRYERALAAWHDARL
jgi:hypothetical protein